MTQIACPNCGASVASTERDCSYCGAALPNAGVSSAATVRASREEMEAMLPQNTPPAGDATIVSTEPPPRFRSSAEAMDAIKADLRAGRKQEAVQTYRSYFKVSAGDAQAAVEQIEFNLKFEESSRTAHPKRANPPRPEAFTPSAQPAREETGDQAAKKSGVPVWVWGCLVAFVLFCCLCVVLPAVLYLLNQNMGRM